MEEGLRYLQWLYASELLDRVVGDAESYWWDNYPLFHLNTIVFVVISSHGSGRFPTPTPTISIEAAIGIMIQHCAQINREQEKLGQHIKTRHSPKSSPLRVYLWE